LPLFHVGTHVIITLKFHYIHDFAKVTLHCTYIEQSINGMQYYIAITQ